MQSDCALGQKNDTNKSSKYRVVVAEGGQWIKRENKDSEVAWVDGHSATKSISITGAVIL